MKPLIRSSAALALVAPLWSVSAPCSANETAKIEAGKNLFLKGATPSCALCHALKDAGAEGTIGPSLDELKPDAERVAKAVKNGIGQMPAFSTLTDQQIEAIARYVERATQAAK